MRSIISLPWPFFPFRGRASKYKSWTPKSLEIYLQPSQSVWGIEQLTTLDGFSDPQIQVDGCDNSILTNGYVTWFWFNEFKLVLF
jgi:hypothetical protein